MLLAPRVVALLAVCGLALACTACGSGNKEKIVGKWKLESGPKGVAAMGDKVFYYMEFAKDDTFKLGLEVNDPAMKEKMSPFADGFVFTGKYTVSGDTLELKPADGKSEDGPFNKAKMKFDGNDKVTITAPDGDMKLTRMK